MKLKRFAFFSVSVIASFLLLVAYLVYLNSSLLLSKTLSRTTQTPVAVGPIGFLRDSFTIQRLAISNPKDAYLPTAFKAETIKVSGSYTRYLRREIVIEKIEIDDVFLNIEFYTEDKLTGNWQALFENMDKSHRQVKSKRQTLIKKLVLRNVHVNLILADGKVHRLAPIDLLEFKELSSEEGFPVKEISEIIAKKMVYSILKEEGLNLIIKIPLKVIKKIFPFLSRS